MQVLIVVKTYPSPSTNYLETVCVAGAQLVDDLAAAWVRLYPIQYRLLDNDDKFAKYQVIDLQVTRHTRDTRPESHRPTLEGTRKLRMVPSTGNWAGRRHVLAPLLGATTVCDLIAGARDHKGRAPSLGAIRPADVDRVYLKDPEPWSQEQLRKAAIASAGDLLREPMPPLRQPPVDIRFRYRCEARGCPGHDQKTLDWEAGMAALRWRTEYGPQVGRQKLLEKWQSMVADDRDAYFFVGNQHQHPQSFSILGNWYPKKEPDALF